MGRLTFALNVTLDGCCDHREGIADDELLDHFTQLIGATGAILVVKALYELARTGGKRALVTMCIGGGQGMAAIFERG